MTRKQKRLAVIGGGVAFLVAAVLLVMFAFSQSIAYFYVPGDIAKANSFAGNVISPRRACRGGKPSGAARGPR